MGLEGDVAIESRLVSKTIENAQSRVEGYNFDIRKRVVEYDDVINKQRETIYAERDKVLHNEDLGDTVLDFVEGEVDVLAEQHLGPVMDDWDLEGLARAVGQPGHRGRGHRGATSPSSSPTRERSWRRSGRPPRRRSGASGSKLRRPRPGRWSSGSSCCASIDQLWVDHLTELDDFRRGVGLRGYGGTDPLVEFKREAFKLYEELRGFIRHQVATTIYRVNVQVQPAHRRQPATLPMPTPEQLALLRARAAAPTSARLRSGAAAGGSDRGRRRDATNGSSPTARRGGRPAVEHPRRRDAREAAVLDCRSICELGRRGPRAVDEVADADVLPAGAAAATRSAAAGGRRGSRRRAPTR